MLHVHTAVRKDITELILEGVKYRDTLLLLSITLTEKISDAESAEKRRNCIKNTFSVWEVLVIYTLFNCQRPEKCSFPGRCGGENGVHKLLNNVDKSCVIQYTRLCKK